MNNLSRRTFTFGTLASAISISSSPVAALTTPEAKRLVSSAVDEINAAIDSGATGQRLYDKFERIFYRYSDVNAIARYALGARARSVSRSELKTFSKAFAKYLSKKYGKRFREFEGGRIQVKGARKLKSFYEVNGTVSLRGRQPIDFSFLVSDRSGSPLFFNIFIGGINMLITEREEINALLDARRGDINRLSRELAILG